MGTYSGVQSRRSRLATGSIDHTVRLWATRTRARIAILTDNLHPVFSVAFSPDAAILAGGGLDNTVRLWDAATRTVATLIGHSEPVVSVAFSRDGTTLASSSYDKTVRLWQLR